MPETKMTEDQMAALVRNALIIAGTEMGADGDHWPVINATIHSVMKDWENLKIERNVHEELRTHLYVQLDRMDEILLTCPDDVKAEAAPKLKKLRDIYDAHFTSIDEKQLSLNEDEKPDHVKRAQAIIKTLEENDE